MTKLQQYVRPPHFILLTVFSVWLLSSAQSHAQPADSAAATEAETEAATPEPESSATEAQESESLVDRFNAALEPINELFGQLNGYIASVIFYPIPLGAGKTIPAAVLWLVFGAGFLTIRMKFINFRGFRHAVLVTMGRYDNPDDEGEVSHFQALTAALSATVGLGNIAGVAIAVSLGGPGATFWMVIAGLLGMSSKFAECTLGQMYRVTRPDGRVMGGAMHYLSRGLTEQGLGGLGKVLAVLFAVLCVGGSFAGGNSFQVRQSLDAVSESIPILADYPWIYGAVMTFAVGIVIIGGIRSIARVAEKIVPLMCGVYVVAALTILVMNADRLPWAVSQIFSGAFSADAAFGGFVGVLITGFKRAAFSNEAGVGSAAIAHSAAKTEYPVREGIVALLEPFIDTVVICTLTALVIVISGAFATEFQPSSEDPAKMVVSRLALEDDAEPGTEAATMREAMIKNQGATLTSLAMDRHLRGFKYVLGVAVILFAYSTMISWSYYGERCWAWMFGDGASMSYRVIFLVFTFLGSILSATNVLDFGDLMILGMAIPNIVGVLLLSGKVGRALDTYWNKLKSGDFDQPAS
ncbi:MAG: alanine/glycine:cation symporter family protein [Fuerstiella sp.]